MERLLLFNLVNFHVGRLARVLPVFNLRSYLVILLEVFKSSECSASVVDTLSPVTGFLCL